MKKLKTPVQAPTLPTITAQVLVVVVKVDKTKDNGTEEATNMETDTVTTFKKERNNAEPSGDDGYKDGGKLNNENSISTSSSSNNENKESNDVSTNLTTSQSKLSTGPVREYKDGETNVYTRMLCKWNIWEEIITLLLSDDQSVELNLIMVLEHSVQSHEMSP